MKLPPEDAHISSDHLLTCLEIAIEEARSARSGIDSNQVSLQTKKIGLYSEKLARDINYLEAKKLQVRAMSHRNH